MSCKSKIFVVFWQNNIPNKYTVYPHQEALVLSPEKAMQMPKARWKYLISTSSRAAAASRQYTQFRGVTLPEIHHLHPAQENKVSAVQEHRDEWNPPKFCLPSHLTHCISDWPLSFLPNILGSCKNNVNSESKEELKLKERCFAV